MGNYIPKRVAGTGAGRNFGALSGGSSEKERNKRPDSQEMEMGSRESGSNNKRQGLADTEVHEGPRSRLCRLDLDTSLTTVPLLPKLSNSSAGREAVFPGKTDGAIPHHCRYDDVRVGEVVFAHPLG